MEFTGEVFRNRQNENYKATVELEEIIIDWRLEGRMKDLNAAKER